MNSKTNKLAVGVIVGALLLYIVGWIVHANSSDNNTTITPLDTSTQTSPISTQSAPTTTTGQPSTSTSTPPDTQNQSSTPTPNTNKAINSRNNDDREDND